MNIQQVNKKYILDRIINNLPVVIAILLLAKNIFYIHKHRDFWYALPASLLIEFVYNKRWKDFTWDKKKFYYLIMLIFGVLFFVYQLFEQHFEYQSLLVFYRKMLIGLAFVGLLGFNHHHKLSYYLNTIIITALVTICYLFFVKIGIFSFLESADKTTLVMSHRIESINSHMVFNLYLNFALVSIWYLVSYGYKTMQRWRLVLYITSFVIIFAILAISEGRSGFLMSLMLVSIILFWETFHRNKYTFIAVLSLFVTFVAFKIFTHTRISEQQIKNEPRLFLWEKAKPIIGEKPILGWGANDGQYQFTKQLREDTSGIYQIFWKPTDFVDTHNQFVQTMIEFGLLGIILRVFLYVFLFFIAEGQTKKLAFLFIFIMFFQSFFDMFVTGQFVQIFVLSTFIVLLSRNDIVKNKI